MILPNDGSAVTITISSTDPEGLPITYSIASDTSANTATVVQGTGANTNIFTVTPSTNSADAGSFSLTFRASDGVNIASAVSTFTLNFVTLIADSNYTAALVTSVGANLADNNDFVDSSTNSHTITPAGNVTQNTFSPYRYGGYSTYFDGNGDSLQLTTSGDLQAIGRTGTQCTIEAWVYLISVSGNGTAMYSQGTAGSTAGNNILSFEIKSDRKVRGMVNGGYSNEAGCPISSGTVPLNTWTHLALVLNSNTWTIYINGAADGTASGTYPSGIAHSSAFIGRIFYDAGRTGEKYIRDLRITNTAEYTTDFAPPTESLTAITGTKLLACHLPYIADGSTNSYAITVNGDTKTEAFSPYDSADEYSTSSNGGAMYFDGSGDGLSAPNHTSFDIGSGDFTIETWFYSSSPDTSYLFGKGNGQNAIGTSFWVSGGAGAGLYLFHGSSYIIMVTGALPANQWTHLAFVRNGTNFSTYINGKSVHSTTASITVNTTTNALQLADYPPAPNWPGFQSDFRFVKGTAVYTGDFSPPNGPLTTTGGSYPSTTNVNTSITAGHTSLLINGTEAGIIDKSQSVKTITLNGDVKSSTTQSKYLSSSMYFDGTGDYVNIENILAGWTSAFTIEAWVYHTSFGAYSNPIFTSGNYLSVGADFFEFGANSTGYYQVFWGGGAPLSVASVAVSTNTWTHMALVRETDNSCTIYMDGISRATFSKSGAIPSPSSPIRSFIGTQSYSEGAGGRTVIGYLSDVRITKGLARYTAADESANIPSEALKG